MQTKHAELRVREYEVYGNHDNARLFEEMAQAYGTDVEGVPTVFLGKVFYAGFGEQIAVDLEQGIGRCIAERCGSPLKRISGSGSSRPVTFSAVVLGALVDAVNPCAFAVLILLITAVLGAGGRARALRAGLAFSLSVYISYYLMGIGLFTAVAAAGVTRALYVAVTVLAVLMGLLNLKDFFWYGKWFVTEVPLKWRPTLKKILGKATSVWGAFLIGFVVSVFLLPCTSGPYVVILGLLAETATRTSALLWLLLYNAVFISPMIAITLAVYFGMTTAEKVEDWRVKHLRTLHLVAGTLLLLLGIGMLVSLYLGRI
jgi:cytochrome c biogenesis protein CcdA